MINFGRLISSHLELIPMKAYLKKILSAAAIIGIFYPPLFINSYAIDDKLNVNYLSKEDKSDYLLGPGDRIFLSISDALPEESIAPAIPASGYIYFPQIGKLYVSGLTVPELIELLNIKYKDILKEPQIKLNIISYRPVRVLVKGEVDTPGLISLAGDFNQRISNTNYKPGDLNSKEKVISNQEIILSPFPTVFDVLQKAGGITNYSKLSEIELIRKDSISNGGGSKKTTINFLDFINNNALSNNLRVLDNDIIIVKRSDSELTKQLSQALKSNLNPKFVDVFVTGRVKIPGKTSVSSSSSLSDAIDVSGGAKFIRGNITFIRFNKDGSTDKRIFPYRSKNKRGSYQNPYLRNGDIIRVGDSIASNTAEILQEFVSPFLGIYGTYKIFD